MMKPIHPGQVLLEYIEDKNWTYETFASVSGIGLSLIVSICYEEVDVDPFTAQKLAKATGRPTELWMALQANYNKGPVPKVGDHCWAVDSEGKLTVLLKTGEDKFYACGDWEGSFGIGGDLRIVAVIPKPAGYEEADLYYEHVIDRSTDLG